MRRDLALRVVLCPKSTTPWSIARAFRWRDMLERGEYATIREIAAAERINESYVGRILRLTLLAPDVVEAMVNGRQSAELTLAVLMRRFSPLWSAQRSDLLDTNSNH
jgi:hypothetical protein